MTPAWLGAIAGVVVAASAVAKPLRRYVLGPVFWVFRRLIGDPVTTWASTTVTEIVEKNIEPVSSAIAELRTRVDDVEKSDRHDHGMVTEAIRAVHTDVREVRHDVKELGAGLAITDQRVARLEEHDSDTGNRVTKLEGK